MTHTIRKLNQKGFSTHLVLPVLVAVVIGAIGGYVLTRSKAAELPTTSAVAAVTQAHVHVTLGGSKNAYLHNPNTKVVQDTPNFADGPTNVVAIAAGQSTDLSPGRGGPDPGYTFYQTCYTLRAPTDAVTAVLTSGTAKKTFTIAADPNYYSRLCVPASTTGTYPNFSVKNTAGGVLYVYQASYEDK